MLESIKRTTIIVLLISTMFAESFSQKKDSANVTSVKGKKNIYLKQNDTRLKYIAYSDSTHTKSLTDSGKLLGKGTVALPKEKLISNLLKRILNKEVINNKDGHIILSLLFNEQGRVVDVGFLIPRFLALSPEQIQQIAIEIKSDLIGKIVDMDSGKKFISWGLRVSFAKVLDGSFLY